MAIISIVGYQYNGPDYTEDLWHNGQPSSCCRVRVVSVVIIVLPGTLVSIAGYQQHRCGDDIEGTRPLSHNYKYNEATRPLSGAR